MQAFDFGDTGGEAKERQNINSQIFDFNKSMYGLTGVRYQGVPEEYLSYFLQRTIQGPVVQS